MVLIGQVRVHTRDTLTQRVEYVLYVVECGVEPPRALLGAAFHNH